MTERRLCNERSSEAACRQPGLLGCVRCRGSQVLGARCRSSAARDTELACACWAAAQSTIASCRLCLCRMTTRLHSEPEAEAYAGLEPPAGGSGRYTQDRDEQELLAYGKRKHRETTESAERAAQVHGTMNCS